ncbi:hypothetical protein [Stieleria mannarensis]|uniref:hypothetical protein n=1 Tax=Stieleria mannarensis TaxID=2755585 RepID=UPI001C724AC1|nr:hypothetical protein [Rhodopirellula sp. JC639]
MNRSVEPSDLTLVQESMVQAAILAPSPDNNQPWKFKFSDQGVDVFLDPSRSLPSDEASMFDLTAIGAAVENAILGAAEYGCISEITCRDLDDATLQGQLPVASITIRPGGVPDPLFDAIESRCTCRKPYASGPLDTEVIEALNHSISSLPSVQVDWITSAAEKKQFGKLIAMTDSLRFRTEAFHAELFRQLRFKPSEVQATRDGLDVRTLELPFGVTTMLRTLKSWTVMQLVHRLRLTPLLTGPSKIAVQKSGAVAVVSVPAASTENFLIGGRAIQRIWLKAAQAGLSMHPLGSLPIFLLQSQPNPAFEKTIEIARRETSNLVPELGNRVIQLAFRVGKSGPPTERSIRRQVSSVMVQ